MTAQEAAELLDTIADRAPKLRAAGVFGEVRLGDIVFIVAPADPGPGLAEERPLIDPLKDPATHGHFGRGAADRVPRFTRTPLIPGEK
ncbi:MAG: hypothetical protein ABR520_11235 [Mycobacteriales bacterium]|nr:hypothetical protein [Actinomycetota bacterium]